MSSPHYSASIRVNDAAGNERENGTGAQILSIENLTLELPGAHGPMYPVRGVSLTVAPGELHAVVGESGSGKSLTCRSVVRLGPPHMRIKTGSVHVEQVDVATLSQSALQRFRGARVGMIFQEPAAHLSPSIRVGSQIAETLRIHARCSRRKALIRAHELAERVGLTPTRKVLRRYPHELSGGMAQRVAIAAAIICGPPLLIADEPTTALDATVQQSVLALIDELRRDLKLGVLLVSHDLAVVERYADTVTVLYAGKVVEQSSGEELFRRPRHPYTQALLEARPRLEEFVGPSDESNEEASQADKPGEAAHIAEEANMGEAARKAGAERKADEVHLAEGEFPEPLVIPGAPPSLRNIPAGCPFHPRCPAAIDVCREIEPPLRSYTSVERARAACHVAARQAGLPDPYGSRGDGRRNT